MHRNPILMVSSVHPSRMMELDDEDDVPVPNTNDDRVDGMSWWGTTDDLRRKFWKIDKATPIQESFFFMNDRGDHWRFNVLKKKYR